MNAVLHGKELEEIDRIISALVDSNEFYNVKSNMEAFLQHLESASKEGQTQIINRFSQRANNVIARSRFPSMPYNALI
ncbi:MAG: hypothetical protein LBT59_22525, partial [Clostridiales bacterium]|nr:hypothetical protein [Clostridiales bacterium]